LDGLEGHWQPVRSAILATAGLFVNVNGRRWRGCDRRIAYLVLTCRPTACTTTVYTRGNAISNDAV